MDITTDTWIKTKNQEEYLSKNPMRKHGHRRWGLPYSWEKLQLTLDHSLTINLIRTAQHEQPCVHLFTEQKQKKHLERRGKLVFRNTMGKLPQCETLAGCATHVPPQGQTGKAELKAMRIHNNHAATFASGQMQRKGKKTSCIFNRASWPVAEAKEQY